MEKYLYVQKTEELARNIVKLAVNLPDDKISAKAKTELISGASKAASSFILTCVENDDIIENLTSSLEQLSSVKFWLEFLHAENKIGNTETSEYITSINKLLSDIASLKNTEKLKLSTAFAGEWLLDD